MITVITPTGSRPEQLALCDRWMQQQTMQEFRWIVLDDCQPASPVPVRADKVITPDWVWKLGDNTQHRAMLALIEEAGADGPIVVAEDDDAYTPHYLQHMADLLQDADLVGESNALYYHIPTAHYRRMENRKHASLCSSAFAGGAIDQLRRECRKKSRMIDHATWDNFRGKKALVETTYSVGIKGLPGRQGIGIGHRLPRGIRDAGHYVLMKYLGDDMLAYSEWLGRP